MLADYVLSVLGATVREKTQPAVGSGSRPPGPINFHRPFSLRYAAWIVAWTCVLIWLMEVGNLPDGFKQLLLGTFLITLGVLVANHLSNLLLFWYLTTHPDEISGKLTISRQLIVSIALYHIVLVMIPTVLIAMHSHNNFARGGVLGTVLLFCYYLNWMRQNKRADPAPADPLRKVR